jgi:hypothetical protein
MADFVEKSLMGFGVQPDRENLHEVSAAFLALAVQLLPKNQPQPREREKADQHARDEREDEIHGGWPQVVGKVLDQNRWIHEADDGKSDQDPDEKRRAPDNPQFALDAGQLLHHFLTF